ncbi:MAG TPA: hypothetical protein VF073_06580, partial [Gaiella sp.]
STRPASWLLVALLSRTTFPDDPPESRIPRLCSSLVSFPSTVLSWAPSPREDRDLDARLFAASGSDALRTAIAKACRALAIPLWSPHDLRHRRVSLLHRQGRSWAEIGHFVGQRNLAVTANTYTPRAARRQGT